MPNTWWGQIHWKVRVWSRERFIEGPSKENRATRALKTWTLWWFFGKTFYRQNWGRGLQGVLPSSDWLEVVFQESQSSTFSFQPVWVHELMLCLKLPSSTRVGALVPTELRDTYVNVLYIPQGGTRTRPHCCTILFFSFLAFFLFFSFLYWSILDIQRSDSQFLKVIQTSEYNKKKKETHRYREQARGCQWGAGRREGLYRGRGLRERNYRYKISSKDILDNRGNIASIL